GARKAPAGKRRAAPPGPETDFSEPEPAATAPAAPAPAAAATSKPRGARESRAQGQQMRTMETSLESHDSDGLEPDWVRLYIVRHAEHVTPALAHLSGKGSLQAVAIANTLKGRNVDAVYSSPRSYETAQNICKELRVKVELDKRLLPYDAGALVGLSMKQVEERMPDVYRQRFVERNPDFRVPEGESLNDRFRRVKGFMEEIVEKHHGKQVVVVTHGGIIDDLFRNARSLPPSQLTGLKKPYGSLSVLLYRNETFEEEVWGGVSHLPEVVAMSPSGGQLYLFPFQVAGSFPMLRGDLGELCKPATQAEIDTYDCMAREAPEISVFAPRFTGKVIIDVKNILENDNALTRPLQYMHGNDSSCRCLTDALPRSQSGCDPEDANAPSARPRTDDASMDMDMDMEMHFDDADGSDITEKDDADKAAHEEKCRNANNGAMHRSWSITSLWTRFAGYRKKKVVEVEPGKLVYLVLEDLTHGLIHPHVLDLKIGVQQHNSTESAAKKAKKQKRVENSTSKTVGARIGGMQVYDDDKDTYILRDKYWGRALDEQGLEDALRSFVLDTRSNQVRVKVINDIIVQLTLLERAVKSSYWRFYGCSVLIVYDSSDPEAQRDRFPSSMSDSIATRSIETMIPGSRLSSHPRSRSLDQIPVQPPSPSLEAPRDELYKRPRDPKFCVQVRLIDFAKCERHREGTDYDRGMVFGLTNLRHMFSRMLIEHPSPSCT
ncbi:Inositol hexakisphosphate kinase 1, partial [Hondaea fermentalgiana]